MPLDKSKEKIGEMFDTIAPTYDSLNHILSFNADKSWRKKAVKKLLQNNPAHILDVATGSGDMILETAKHGNFNITGIDISVKMIEIAQQKVNKKYPKLKLVLQKAPAESIPFDDNSFDAACVAFGVRNFEDLPKGLCEINRVLKPDSIFVVLEFVKPQRKIIRTYLKGYLKYGLPFIGRIISKNKQAYSYLIQSIEEFYTIKDFEKLCSDNHFTLVETKSLFRGLVAIFVLKK
jgi:demethylmenaquinone methyltransferase/2-methoxy-6-polyprenyl-1,4-benzoquinol methylase